MEVLDLYYEEFVKSGDLLVRGDQIPENRCAMIIFVCVFDHNGRLLVQQRQKTKKSWPCMWDVSAGGVVQTGETSRNAACRELLEETGIAVQEDALTKVLSIYYDREIHDIFTVVLNSEAVELKLQEEEVMDAKWVSLEEAKQMIRDGRFIPVYEEFLALLFTMQDKKGIMKFI